MCTGNFIVKQSCRDGVINGLLSWYRHLLVATCVHYTHTGLM